MTIALASLPRLAAEPVVIPTLMQDPGGKYEQYIEQYHTQTLSRLLCQNAAVVINRGSDTLINNYEQLPTPKINQLVIPTGATRWSYCLLLADDDIKNRIYTACDNGGDPMSLMYGSSLQGSSEDLQTIVLTVWLLPPRRLSPETNQDLNNLWIIPVVDDRYWWQFSHTDDLSGSITDGEITAPDDLLDLLLAISGTETLNVKVNPLHTLIPTCAKTNDHENLPIVIDSVCAHFGQRLVIDIWPVSNSEYGNITPMNPTPLSTRFAVIDGVNSCYVFKSSVVGQLGLKEATWGTYGTIDSESDSASAASVNVGAPFLVAGGFGTLSNGDSAPIPRTVGPYACVPESVDIQTTDGNYTNITAADVSASAYKTSAGGAAVWRTKFDTEPDIAQVTQIGKDYYYQFAYQYDMTFAGVQPWQQGYFDDYMVFRQTWNPKTGGYDAYTRVCSRTPNMTGEWTGKSATLNVKHGIVIASLGRGYYTIRMSNFTGTLPVEGEETLCENLAAQVDVEGETYTDCTATQNLPAFEETEDGSTPDIVTRQTTAISPTEDVKAFHRASIFVPLKVWSEVLMIDNGDTIGSDTIYQIVDGFQQHIIAYDKQYECCALTGEWKLVSRTPYIFAGVTCGVDSCEPCPTV